MLTGRSNASKDASTAHHIILRHACSQLQDNGCAPRAMLM